MRRKSPMRGLDGRQRVRGGHGRIGQPICPGHDMRWLNVMPKPQSTHRVCDDEGPSIAPPSS